MSGIGLMGTSGTGKTTLAKKVNEITGVPYIASQVRPAYIACGILPGVEVTHAQKMKAQNLILDVAENDYANVDNVFITDRTPMDFAAHVLAEATATNLSDEETLEVLQYVRRCYALTNLYFASLILIQPALKMVTEPGRTSNAAYVAHISVLMAGLISDPANKLYCAKHVMGKSIIDLTKRAQTVIKLAAYIEGLNMKLGMASINH